MFSYPGYDVRGVAGEPEAGGPEADGAVLREVLAIARYPAKASATAERTIASGRQSEEDDWVCVAGPAAGVAGLSLTSS